MSVENSLETKTKDQTCIELIWSIGSMPNGKKKPKHLRFTPEAEKYVEARLAQDGCLKRKKSHPYHSWERGSNENLNGLIRQYFPKKIDFTQITDKEIQNAKTKLNN